MARARGARAGAGARAAGARRRARARGLSRRALPRAGAGDAGGRRWSIDDAAALRALAVRARSPSSTCCRGRRGRRTCPEGTIWRDQPHAVDPRRDLAAEHRLPGSSAPETLAYFLDGLAAATGGDTDAAAGRSSAGRDCWMSWNAAQARARARLHPGVLVSRRGRRLGGWRAARSRRSSRV